MFFFCILLIGQDKLSSYDTIINISYVIFLVLLELSKYFLKINKNIISMFQIMIIIIVKIQGFSAVNLFIPLMVYEIFNWSIINFIVIITVISSNFTFFKEPISNEIIYTILLYLYLFEAESKFKDKIELKRLNKLQGLQKDMLQEKVVNIRKYMEQKDITAALKERNYMAQKIHDHMGHRVTSAIMQLEVVKETMGKSNEISMKYLLTAMDSLRCGMDEVREFLRNSKPGEGVVSLEEIKKDLLSFQYSTNIKTHIEIKGDIKRFKTSQIAVIQDNLREALTNASKYSKASNLYFSINVYNKFARIGIRDDGRGSSDITKSLGLMGMEERIEAINGKIQFYNDEGFVINMIINF
ncbi:Signal transduction histidine kinase [Clostridium sp. DSM 8431]|uniref:sensor histidine kinase n=1 Tax=Clostridium sp. DSM 8431 TaxID=1761781 RepID=UPI0008E78808|nr:histidine kinase [Clostridium sp. DSM 8431]SFU35477.1 Signal transduction histidine kinase [Clostridium sp. DSM 8431]